MDNSRRLALHTTIRPYTPRPARPTGDRFSFSFDIQHANTLLTHGETAHSLLNVDMIFNKEDIVILGGTNDAIEKFLCPNIPSLANQRHRIAVMVESVPRDLDVYEERHLLRPALRYAIDEGVSLFGVGAKQGPTLQVRANALIAQAVGARENSDRQRIIEDLVKLTQSVCLALQGQAMDASTTANLNRVVDLADQLKNGRRLDEEAMRTVASCAYLLKGPILDVVNLEQKTYVNVRIAAPIRNSDQYDKLLVLVGTSRAAVADSDKPSIAELVDRTGDGKKVDVALLTNERWFAFKCHQQPDHHQTTTEKYLHVPVQDSNEYQAARTYQGKAPK